MRSVKWSHQAKKEFENIFNYWVNRTKSSTYSNKIIQETDKTIQIIRNSPEIGIHTNYLGVQMCLLLNTFYIIYRINDNQLEILKFWDCRQDPLKNQYYQ